MANARKQPAPEQRLSTTTKDHGQCTAGPELPNPPSKINNAGLRQVALSRARSALLVVVSIGLAAADLSYVHRTPHLGTGASPVHQQPRRSCSHRESAVHHAGAAVPAIGVSLVRAGIAISKPCVHLAVRQPDRARGRHTRYR